ncbi:GatB/YqeY domain-containing protein [Candidatus Uhrbacteria bacterium]|nr:GatB/YqeY domain-containing protein [Candidatus Uhrbacteria bacterium]MBD3283896.1 GatB/YqeY domain-containing protein [Candidatus Uhrbacteria bacterium]
MNLAERIAADYTSAMKSKNELELSTLRLVRSALKNKQIETGAELDDAAVQAVLKTMKKQYTDALADFEKAGRADLLERQKAELEVVERYLPEAMSDEELERVVKQAVEASGVTTPDGMGKVMGAAMKAVEGRADGDRVRAVVLRLLTASE